MDMIGIKVKTKDQITSCIKVLRSYTELSMGEIKQLISSDDYVYECRFVDGKGIKKIISICNDLNAVNVETEIFEHGRTTNIEFLMNLVNTYSEIEADVDRIIDEEIDN
ncbi:hypothetical protein SAMN02910298_01959 [Pseudobutyrivibrio sp. YE44]|uniref:hypothetical protein n=1 Tax=Pseudobutyrivibrio sp. YE44 TaxID=1520802 RepID=UPI0008801157|nr:hypothetical protein [Pseudobutyrivibrio sp. YE44]SDB40108.1 hypothetical protein SAMN02910298_01959 [Pseudobutyrivibrio sp. YE44]